MYNKVTMEKSICQAENEFSFNELAKKLADAGTSFSTTTVGADIIGCSSAADIHGYLSRRSLVRSRMP